MFICYRKVIMVLINFDDRILFKKGILRNIWVIFFVEY